MRSDRLFSPLPDTPPTGAAQPAARRWPIQLLLVLLALGALAAWWQRGRPQPAPAAPDGPVQCVSYAPFRQPGETPFDPKARVDEQRIAADLAILAQRTRCVRTYSVQQGLDAVPRVARRLGMTVLLGVWLGRDRSENAA